MADVKILGQRVRELYLKNNFLVEIAGGSEEIHLGFQSCSELSAEVTKGEYREGGTLYPIKYPGVGNYSDVTLERGAAPTSALYTWFLECFNYTGGTLKRGSVNISPSFYRSVTIFQLKEDRNIDNYARRWRLVNAFPIKYIAGDWDATSESDVTIESVTLAYEYFY